MNKWDLEVQESLIESEKEALKELEKAYKQAMLDVTEKLKTMQFDPNNQSNIYRRQHQFALRQQIAAAIVNLQSNAYKTIDQFLSDTYDTAYIGAMYGMGKPKGGLHLIQPIDRNASVKAILTDSKINKGLYNALGVDANKLKKAITHEITRGIASDMPYPDIAARIADRARAPLSRAKVIARTEGHRIQQASQDDARREAKKKGADVVKQWDATLDSGTRPTHRKLDGQIREIDEPFEMDGKKAMYPGKFGRPEEDCNCRCVALTRARWALDEEELETMKERAKFFGLDKTEDFIEYKKKYLKAAETLKNEGKSGKIDVGKTLHALERMTERNISNPEIDNAVKAPLFVGEVTTDEQGRKSQKYIGKDVTVIRNPDTGQVITSWKTSTRLRRKYGKEE
ncbi:phage minor head protein [Candidatus Proelusimicrobium excrementi]|uniref:phage minor head protein n=1 Tax=Candidatus Proelusimicrobium excrementi TaxID=3416222 RepID=UPI003CB9FB76|nr:hypothetical protein [Elusimicrobiaceae bacterium]MBR3927728.1 hypothetical protein [Clostridia bacterium]